MDEASKTPRPKALTGTEENILKAAVALPFFTAEDMTRFLSTNGSHGSNYRALLKKLSGGDGGTTPEYLYQFGMPNAPGNFRRIYTLSRRGAALLRELGVDVDFWYRKYKASHRSFSYLQHHLAVTKCIVSLACFTRLDPSFELIETQHGFALAKNPPRLTVVTDGPETTVSVIPDAFVYIERTIGAPPEVQGYGLWIEVDCGTETKAKFQQLVLNRVNFVLRKGYETYFGLPSVLFCFLSVGATMDHRLSRLHTMRQWTAAVLAEQKLDDWATIFRFSTIDECLYDTLMLFTDQVWYLPDQDTLVPLFPPPQEQEEGDGSSQTTDRS